MGQKKIIAKILAEFSKALKNGKDSKHYFIKNHKDSNDNEDLLYLTAWTSFYVALRKHGVELEHFGLPKETPTGQMSQYFEENFLDRIDVVEVIKDKNYAKEIAKEIINKKL